MVQEIRNSTKKKRIALIVNGKNIEAEIDTRMTLAEFLRDELKLTGTKVGCNRGACGSCTVILDKNPVYSCTVLAVETGGKEVLTVEGLTSDENLHPLQKAFIDNDALQCGYCTSGMLMSIKAFMEENPNPTEHDVKNAIDGNLCRCGCYPNIIKAALSISERTGCQERDK